MLKSVVLFDTLNISYSVWDCCVHLRGSRWAERSSLSGQSVPGPSEGQGSLQTRGPQKKWKVSLCYLITASHCYCFDGKFDTENRVLQCPWNKNKLTELSCGQTCHCSVNITSAFNTQQAVCKRFNNIVKKTLFLNVFKSAVLFCAIKHFETAPTHTGVFTSGWLYLCSQSQWAQTPEKGLNQAG